MAEDSKFKTGGEGSFLTYNKRIIYNGTVWPQQVAYSNLTDFNFGEKLLYGRVSRNFMPMYASSERLSGLKDVNAALVTSNQQLAFDFVIDAFKDLQFQFEKKVANNKIDPNHKFLSHLRVHKSYEDPFELFAEHQKTYTDTIVQFFKEKNIKVLNFKEFINHFFEIIQKSLPTIPFTFSAYIKSKYCPANVSGLVIEIADEDYFNDLSKIQNFVDSDSWEFFLNACSSYGFMVDKNIPWRIVADIGSNEMLNYSSNYISPVNTNSLISSYYERPDILYFDKFVLYLHNLYHKVILKNITHLEICNGRTIRRYVTPEKYTINDLKSIFSEKRFLKLYFDIRILEEEKQFSDSEKSRLYTDSFSVYNIKDLADSLFLFENIVNQPFDYRGSLSYNVTRSKKGHGDKLVLPNFRRQK